MDVPLRIALLVNPPFLSAKGGSHAPQLAAELLGLGHTVRGFGAPPGVIPRSGPDTDPSGHASGGLHSGVVGFRPDVVVAYDALAPAALAGARAARRTLAPLVLVEAGHAAPAQLAVRSLRSLAGRVWGPYVRRSATTVVALDPVAREQTLRHGVDEARVELLPEGVDLTRFRPGLLSAQLAQHRIHGRVLLYAGHLDPSRGVDVLLQAFARTVGQRSDWCLVIAGEGPSASRLRAMADRLGVGGRVAWLGRPRLEELPGLMGGSTLIAVPALDSSVLGEHVPRAMACGLPVLASDLPRLRWRVEHEGSGLVVPPGDLPAWTAALERAATSPEARRRWGCRARALAEERFAWPAVARRFAALLHAALATRELGVGDDRRRGAQVSGESPDRATA